MAIHADAEMDRRQKSTKIAYKKKKNLKTAHSTSELTHLKTKIHICAVCGKVFKRNQNYLRHMWNMHPSEESQSRPPCLNSSIKQDEISCVNIQIKKEENRNDMVKPIPLDHSNSPLVISQDENIMNTLIDETPASRTILHDSLHSQNNMKKEGITTIMLNQAAYQQEVALIAPFTILDTPIPVLLLHQVKTEPEGQDEQDSEQKSTTLEYPLEVLMKHEEIPEVDSVDHYPRKDEENEMKTSETAYSGLETNEHKSALCASGDIKSEIAYLSPEVSDTVISEQKSISDRTKVLDKQHHSNSEKCQSCNICGKRFNAPKHLTKHLISHSDHKPHACDLCEKSFKVRSHLKQHKQTCHSNERPYSCDVCGKAFKRISIVNQHKAACHSNERPYLCDVCGKSFKELGKLTEHKICHSNERPHSCNVCGKAFKRSNTLNQHKALCQSNKRPYSCSVCGKAFNRVNTLSRHKASCHSDERPYSCEVCGKAFKARGVRNKHKAACHSDERPFSCDLCGKAFKARSGVGEHKAMCHSDERPHSCSVCGKAFKLAKILYRHEASCHSKEGSES